MNSRNMAGEMKDEFLNSRSRGTAKIYVDLIQHLIISMR